MRRRGWGAAVLVIAAVSGTLVVQGVTGGGSGDSGNEGKSGPIRTSAKTAALKVAADGTSAGLVRRDTAPFSMLGVTWVEPSARVTGTIEARARNAEHGTWSKWLRLDGNTASASVSGTPVILQETSATRSGTWTAKSSTSYLGGKAYGSSTKNASLTWTFTGRSAALVVSRAATSGQVYVYVDGKKTATVDLRSTTTKYRDAIWTNTWTTAAKHTVKIVVVGTGGRPTVTTDGLVYLN